MCKGADKEHVGIQYLLVSGRVALDAFRCRCHGSPLPLPLSLSHTSTTHHHGLSELSTSCRRAVDEQVASTEAPTAVIDEAKAQKLSHDHGRWVEDRPCFPSVLFPETPCIREAIVVRFGPHAGRRRRSARFTGHRVLGVKRTELPWCRLPI